MLVEVSITETELPLVIYANGPVDEANAVEETRINNETRVVNTNVIAYNLFLVVSFCLLYF